MKYRAALIGCGLIGSELADDSGSQAWGVTTHAGAYAACKATELVAVCDTNRDRAERCGQRWAVQARYTEPARMLAEQRPDLVSICSPDATHYQLVRTALQAEGVKAVLAEKPIATKLSDANELVQLARQRGIVLAVNYSRRYAESHVRLRAFLRKGGIGTIRLARGLYVKGTIHNGSHWFDLARYLVGEVASVTSVNRLGEASIDPTLDVHLQFSNRAVGELFGCSSDEFTVFEMDLVGTLGRVRLSEAGSVMEYYQIREGNPFAGYRGLEQSERTEGGMRDVLLHAVGNLVECVQNGTPPKCSGEDGCAALAIALAAHESAVTGRKVSLSCQ